MKLNEIKTKQVAIWGYGLEGQATLAYLNQRCPELRITVFCPQSEIPNEVPELVKFKSDEVNANLLNQYNVVIKSPGISPYQAAVENTKCEIISSAALWFSNERSGIVIAVTGTKGKSTTAAMITEVLSAMNHRVVLAGNFGVPLIQCLDNYDYVVLETSSYQAYDGGIKADIGVLLNLFSEHLNWHLTEQQYHHDKWQLLINSQQAILNAKDENTTLRLKQQPLQVEPRYFQSQHGFYELNHVLMYQDKALLSQHGWPLKGAHNLINAAAVCAVISLLELDLKTCLNVIKKFKGLPHRLQQVAEIDGVNYINDSIASTPHATLAAMKTVDLTRTILLIGGFDRGVDWQWWTEAIAQMPPKVLICSGENGQKIYDLVLNQAIKTQCIWQPSLKAAVKTAKELAQAGDCVLLSPGAPSFDAFDNYQDRGQKFTQWIK